MTPAEQAMQLASTLAPGTLWQAGQVFARTGALVALLPGIGDQGLPLRVRLAAALALSAIVFPLVGRGIDPAAGPLALPAEALAGLALGLALRLVIVVLQVAAAMAAQAISISQILGGAGPEPQPALGTLMAAAGLVLLVSAGLHVRAAELLVLSYDLWPAGRFLPAPDLAAWTLGRVSAMFSAAFVLALPFTVAALLYNLALGIINRALPQMMVTFVGAPALAAGGLALIALAVPAGLQHWQGLVEATLTDPFSARP